MRNHSKKLNNATVGPYVSGYISGVTEYIESDTGADQTGFDVDAVISTAWESVGPTGSSATNIWTDMDIIPTGAKWVEIKIYSSASDASGLTVKQTLHGRVTGSSTAAADANAISLNHSIATGSTVNFDGNITTAKIPIDSSRRFDLYRNPSNGTAFVCNIYLIGWGI